MNPLKTAWRWLLQPNHRETLALLGAGLVVVIAALWQVYVHVSEQDTKPTPPSMLASTGVIGVVGDVSARAGPNGTAIIATGDVTISITLAEYEAGLRQKEQAVSAELRAARATDKRTIDLLEHRLAALKAQLQNPQSALADYKAKLAAAYQAIDDLKQDLPPEKVKQAQAALTHGQTAAAEQLFTQVLTQGTAQAAAVAAYQLGALDLAGSEYPSAERNYQQAEAPQPAQLLRERSEVLPGQTDSIGRNDWQVSWLDLNPPMNFSNGDTLKIKVTGNAKKVIVRLLPESSSPESSDGIVSDDIVGEIRDVPSNKIIKITLNTDYTNIKQISVHAGKQAFYYTPLNDNNGKIKVTNITRVTK